MLLQDKIKQDSMLALKEGRKEDRIVLSTLSSQIKNKALEKRVSGLLDSDAVQVIQKFLKSLEDEIEAFKKANRTEKVEELTRQHKLVKEYLPKMLSEDEIKNIISLLEDKTMKNIMSHFKNNYNGKVDMSLVSRIAKNA